MIPCCCQSAFLNSGTSPDFELRVPATIDPARNRRSVPALGVVVFRTHRQERAEAILDADGTWRCPVLPVLDRVLNALHEPRRNPRPDMPFGHVELIRVAAWLNGEAKIHRS